MMEMKDWLEWCWMINIIREGVVAALKASRYGTQGIWKSCWLGRTCNCFVLQIACERVVTTLQYIIELAVLSCDRSCRNHCRTWDYFFEECEIKWAKIKMMRRTHHRHVVPHAALLKVTTSNWRIAPLAILLNTVASNAKRTTGNSTSETARNERLSYVSWENRRRNYVMNHCSGNRKASILATVQSAACVSQLV